MCIRDRFLGIHILQELLKNKENTIYCVVRPKNNISPEKRLKGTLSYYFEDNYAHEFGLRLHAVDGDVLREEIADLPEGVNIDTVIHCAADVSHFDVDGRIRETNVRGVQNLSLIHI